MRDRVALKGQCVEAPSRQAVEVGFSLLSFQYDPDESERVRRAIVRDMYLAMRKVELADNDD